MEHHLLSIFGLSRGLRGRITEKVRLPIHYTGDQHSFLVHVHDSRNLLNDADY